MMNENERILNLITKLMGSESLSKFLSDYDYSINLFGLKISDTKHYFLRLSKPKDDVVLWMQEEYIPKLDHNGNWIEYPSIENPRVERISPSVKYIPSDLTYDEFKKNLRQFFEQLKAYKLNHPNKTSSNNLAEDVDLIIEDINL